MSFTQSDVNRIVDKLVRGMDKNVEELSNEELIKITKIAIYESVEKYMADIVNQVKF
ncbi:hypothetical protein [Desulfosporosinus sp. SB140]|uniref:hypothetical protein n=1 Tax=Desulfosporosinus paludis TaxID=3115649 RepID=UPI00388D5BD2